MKRILKKLRSRRGMSLSELLMAVLVLSLLTAAIVVGINSAIHVYRGSVTVSEAQTLTSTLTESLSNELRYAQNIRVQGSGQDRKVIFDSRVFGPDVTVQNDPSGVILVGPEGSDGYELLSSRAYTAGLTAAAAVDYDPDGKIFTLTVTVQNPEMAPREATVSVRALNP